jgi:hypothetical protein
MNCGAERGKFFISRCLKNIFESDELNKESVVAFFATTDSGDNYIDESSLIHLSKKNRDVKVLLLTKNISKRLTLDVEKANEQYGDFEIKTFTKSHGRFLIIDGMEVYHLGASLKDLGKKWFVFSKLDKNTVVSRILSVL